MPPTPTLPYVTPLWHMAVPIGDLRERRKVQCPECAGDVPVLREFCPHCGAPTDPGLRARQREPRGERSDDHLRGNRKKVLIGGAAILAVLAVMGKISLPGPDIRIHRLRDCTQGVGGPPTRAPVPPEVLEAERRRLAGT